VNKVHSKEWFDEAFSIGNDGSLPDDIRRVSERICRAYGISDICDPMYIANVIALELSRGDGKGMFYEDMVVRQPGYFDEFYKTVPLERAALFTKLCPTVLIDGEPGAKVSNELRQRDENEFLCVKYSHENIPHGSEVVRFLEGDNQLVKLSRDGQALEFISDTGHAYWITLAFSRMVNEALKG